MDLNKKGDVTKFASEQSEFIYVRTYAKWIDELSRRETWPETVQRFINFIKEERGKQIPAKVIRKITEYLLTFDVLPSMRALWAAGDAAKKDSTMLYNCSFASVNNTRVFAEAAYILMCGCGFGFSVQKSDIEQLPIVPTIAESKGSYVIEDSRAGWADSIDILIRSLYSGYDLAMDYNQIRPMGARLKTTGGRASGPAPLAIAHDFIRETFIGAQGRRLKSIECHDIMNQIAEIVVAGGNRRSSEISLSDIDDEEMRSAKIFPFPRRRVMANNSAIYTNKPNISQFLKEWTSLVESQSGERGIFNLEAAHKNSPPRRNTALIKGCNPCLSGDTLVYVADGRGHVTIKQLADEGKDVPVFCLNDKQNVSIRYMRNPRVTGYESLIKIGLSDGSFIKTTKNHKFLLRSGNYVQVDNLKLGDSLKLVTKYEASIKDIFPEAHNSQDYYWINNGKGNSRAEHSHIAEFFNNTKIQSGHVVHHIDRNAKNNNPSNLQILTKEAHDKLHAQDMIGDKNPMRRAKTEWSDEKWAIYRLKHSINNSGEKNKRFSGYTHEDLKHYALKLTKILNRRFSTDDWKRYAKENKLPQQFSKWRVDHLGGVQGLAKWAAMQAGIENINEDPRIIATYKRLLDEGYNCSISDGIVSIIKLCEACSKEFIVSIGNREVGVCSNSCKAKNVFAKNKDIIMASIKNNHNKKKAKLRDLQIVQYNNAKSKLGRDLYKKEWIEECKNNSVSFEISRKSSPFKCFNDLKEAVSNFNHTIISIEEVNSEIVYNGTVDQFHNFFVGGFESKTQNGKRKFQYLNNLQCGEIMLRDSEFCNLSEVVIKVDDDLDSLLEKIETATWIGAIQSTFTYFPYLGPKWTANCNEERLLGVSLTGQMDNPKLLTPEVLQALKARAIRVAIRAAKILDINIPAAITTTKPSGTVSQLVNSASGVHPRYSEYYIRRYRIANTDPLLKMLVSQGIEVVPETGQTKDNATTWVVSFPVASPKGCITRKDMNAIDQLEWYKRLMENYCEHNASLTVYVKDDEWLKVGEWVWSNWEIVNGVSFLPYDGGKYELAPYEEMDAKTYKELKSKFPKIDYSKLSEFEMENSTTELGSFACVGDKCEIDILS